MSITGVGAKDLVLVRAAKRIVQVAVPVEFGHTRFHAQIA